MLSWKTMQGQGNIELKRLKSVLQDNSYKQWMFRISPKTGTKLKVKSSPIVLTVSHFATCKEFQKSLQKFSKNTELAHSTSLFTPSGSIFSGGFRGGFRLGPPPPLIFRANWGPKGLKKIFWDRAQPLALSQGLEDRPPPIPTPPPLYLKVQIRHWFGPPQRSETKGKRECGSSVRRLWWFLHWGDS